MPSEAPHLRMSGEDRRRQLLEVAIDLFSQKGFGGTTTKEIAAAAGVTEAIIFRHFATKQDLYKAILDYKCGEKEQWLSEAAEFMKRGDDAGLFRFVLVSVVGANRDEPRFERLLLHAALEGHELAIMHHNQLVTGIGAQFKEYVARRQAVGAIRPCDPLAVIFAVVGMAKHYSMYKYLYGHGDLAPSDDRMIDAFLGILMDGIRITPQKGKSK